jgi:hypothetical protein
MSDDKDKAGEFYQMLKNAKAYGPLELKLLLQVYILTSRIVVDARGERLNQLSMTDHAWFFGVTLPAISRCVVALEALKLITRVRIPAKATAAKRAYMFVELQMTPNGNREVRRILGIGEGGLK